ncbi:hypothetical protein ACVME8_002988 [Bradyrhizobium diazoefficiens]
MTAEHGLIISFPDSSVGEANRLAVDLKNSLLRIASARGLNTAIRTTIEKQNETTQDFGASLGVILATPAVVAVAKGIHDWISAHGNKVVIKHKHGDIIATGSSAKNIDIAETVRALERLG